MKLQMDAGKTTARGSVGLVAPNWLITEDAETHGIDGVEINVQNAPQTEAPAEFHNARLRRLPLQSVNAVLQICF